MVIALCITLLKPEKDDVNLRPQKIMPVSSQNKAKRQSPRLTNDILLVGTTAPR